MTQIGLKYLQLAINSLTKKCKLNSDTLLLFKKLCTCSKPMAHALGTHVYQCYAKSNAYYDNDQYIHNGLLINNLLNTELFSNPYVVMSCCSLYQYLSS